MTTPARAEHRHGDDTIEPARPATQGVRPHDLRHSAAVAWLTAGVPVVQVSRWLGHAQPTITLNVYGDWVPETVENPLPEPVARTVVVPMRHRDGGPAAKGGAVRRSPVVRRATERLRHLE
ncbi:MAG: tyrosine-type recombinase/integrase, partial [Mycobacterium sp.]